MNNIPIFRAKKIDSDEYVEGFVFYKQIEDKAFISGDAKNLYSKSFEVDLSTLAIHFEDMLDSQGNKIFASLSEDGKGGDICDLYLFKNQDKPTRENYTCRYKNQKIMFKNFNFENYAKIEIIGIQE